MYKLPVIVATSLAFVVERIASSTVSSVTIPSLGNMEVRLLSKEDEKTLHNMAVDPPHASSSRARDSQLYHYDYAPTQHQQKGPLLDYTWIPEVTQVEPGTLVGVELSWAPRGWTGVEYLVSWAEEGGMVSGHLVTKDTKAEVSLWPGMKYYIQIELLDFQGNTMMKSHASPVIFQITSIGTTTTTSTSSTTKPKVDHSITTAAPSHPSSISASYSTTYTPSSPRSELHLPSFPSEPSTTTPPTTTAFTTTSSTTTSSSSTTTILPTTKLPITSTARISLDTVNIQINNIEESKNIYAENVPLPNDVRNEVIIDYPSRVQVLETFENHRDEDVRVDVLQIYEVDGSSSVTGTPSMSAMVVWGTGVAMGALLVLCLCVLALWVLRKSRKTKVPEYLEESVLSSNLSSSEKGENQIKSSWKFETFAGSPSKEHLVMPLREQSHCGIDNASLVENYIIVMENPYHSRPLPPLPPVRELRY